MTTARLRFGLHYALSCADGQSALQRYRDTIEQAVSAEAFGFESVWPVEQHFHPRFSALPCPMVLLAAIAERTRTLRLGTAIVQLPLTHPLRAAEEMATLDVISGGRTEFGVGRGSNPAHFAGFGVPLAESRERMIEGLALLRKAFAHERFSFHGRFYQADDAALIPRPVQRPHPPLRIAANGLETAEFAGREGLPILAALHINPLPKLRELLGAYAGARRSAGHGEVRTEDVTLVLPLYVAATRGQLDQEVAPSFRHLLRVLGEAAEPLLARCEVEEERVRLQAILQRLRSATFESANEAMGIFDTPEACVARIAALRESVPFGRLVCWFNPGGLVPSAQVIRSMQLFAERVLPEF